MVRAILLGLLAISAAAGCKSGGEGAPTVEPGKTVGKVVELKGSVRATRGDTTRTLAAGGEVSGDDVIETGGDGRVTIVLAHNNATWDLGPNKKEQVSASMAWSLAKAERAAGSVDETTTAAGRHAERHAATGGESAGAPAEKREREAAPASTDPAPAAATAPAEPTRAPTAPAPGGAPPPSADSAAPPPVQAPTAAVTAPPPPPPPPADPRRVPEKAADKATANAKGGGGAKTTRGGGDELDALLEGGGGKLQKRAPSGGGGGDAAAPDPATIRAALQAQMPALRACVSASGKDKLTITLEVTAGKTTITLPDGTDADRACFAKVATAIKLSGTTAKGIAVSIPKAN
ncbi:MAG: hypothetical protein JNL83_28905 [Myxococcales bacterium]|nr:hypothetical protein [Myxococcales bacterium]